MPHVLTLSVPVDAPYRALAAEVAGRVVVLLGGTAAQAERFQGTVAEVVNDVATEQAETTLVFGLAPARVELRVTCGRVSRLLTQTLGAP